MIEPEPGTAHELLRPPPTSDRYLAGAVALSLAGCAISGLLAYQHDAFARHLPGCGPGSPFDCYAVNASVFSEIRGIPVAWLGVMAYAAILGLVLVRLRRGHPAGAPVLAVAFLLAVGSILFSVVLAGVSVLFLRMLCLYCCVLYLVNIALLGATWEAQGGPRAAAPALRYGWARLGRWRPAAIAAACVGAGLGLWVLVRPVPNTLLYFFNGPDMTSPRFLASVRRQTREELVAARVVDPGPERGNARGSSTPLLTIVVFTDLECPACRKSTWVLSEFLAAHPSEVRAVVRHWPASNECNPAFQEAQHPRACEAARAAEAAACQGRFFEFVEAVLARVDGQGRPVLAPDLTPGALKVKARRLGLDPVRFTADLNGNAVRARLAEDVALAGRIGVETSPTWIVNGRVVAGGQLVATMEEWLRMAREGLLGPVPGK